MDRYWSLITNINIQFCFTNTNLQNCQLSSIEIVDLSENFKLFEVIDNGLSDSRSHQSIKVWKILFFLSI